MKERLQKVLAAAGIGSRRRAEELIASGQVSVNGEPAHLGQVVDPERDLVAVGGKPVSLEPKVYLALNKPRGYVTSLRSTHGEPTVRNLVHVPERIFPVGRLDKDTIGLLLLTNDGNWANLIMHPRHGIEKQYFALIAGHPSASTLRQLREGVVLGGGERMAPARVDLLDAKPGRSSLSITLMEGKKRQIRHMLEAVGHPVITLERVRIGPIRLGNLPERAWRYLSQEEVQLEERAAGEPARSRP